MNDRFGLPLSTSAEARDAYVAGVDCVLTASAGAEEHLGRALAADPRALAQSAPDPDVVLRTMETIAFPAEYAARMTCSAFR